MSLPEFEPHLLEPELLALLEPELLKNQPPNPEAPEDPELELEEPEEKLELQPENEEVLVLDVVVAVDDMVPVLFLSLSLLLLLPKTMLNWLTSKQVDASMSIVVTLMSFPRSHNPCWTLLRTSNPPLFVLVCRRAVTDMLQKALLFSEKIKKIYVKIGCNTPGKS